MASGKKRKQFSQNSTFLKHIFALQEQRKRKQDIEQVCDEHGDQLYFDVVPLFDYDYGWPYIIYLQQYNLLFCGVPKAGTSTWVVGRDQVLNMEHEF